MHTHGSMNRFYRLVWSEVRRTWVPAAEIARGRGKTGRPRRARQAGSAVAALALLNTPLIHAGPAGGQVVGGKGGISQSGNTTTILQSSQNLSINWQSFNVGPQDTVDFLQPSASAIAVNRIFDPNGSQILGHLDANGQVYLINPNGIVFGRGAQVNVGGLVASTLDVDDGDLAGDTRRFAGTGAGAVVNQGTISAAQGGSVALLGNHVSNQGLISARLGTVALGAGSGVTLTFDGDRLLALKVDRSVLNTLAENGGILRADGGQVVMTAGARDALLASVVNNTGVIEARTVEDHNGSITLLGGMEAGTVRVGGTLDASAPGAGDGGRIETSAAHVEVGEQARITTAAGKGLYGSWLVDPQDFTVAASGGDISGATLSSELNTTSVTLQSSSGKTGGSGNVNVNDAVSWSANTALTLTASNNVNINASITAMGATAGLTINPATANGAESASPTGSFNLGPGATINLPNVSASSVSALVIGGVPYAVLNTLGAAGSTTGLDLQGIAGNLSGHYALGSSIDATSTSSWNAGAGFAPIQGFLGVFDGLGHTITGLTISLPASDNVGLFGSVGVNGGAAATLRNVGLVGGSVTGASDVGALVGTMNYGNISNSYASTRVTGSGTAGGLVGIAYGSSITASHATGMVSGGAAGGLVGVLGYGSVSNSYATGAVSGVTDVGGLVGLTFGGSIGSSFASGKVTGSGYAIGGLLGNNAGGAVTSSYASGNVSGGFEVGGLVGAVGHYSGVYSIGTVSDSYATGNVSGSDAVGGLVGVNIEGGNIFDQSTITNSYARGRVTGGTDSGGLVGANGGVIVNSYSSGAASGSGAAVGGLVGHNYGTVTGSFWDTTTSGLSSSQGGLGLTTAQLQNQSNFTSATAANGNVNPAWDFSNTWVMYNGHTYPLLRNFMTPLTVTANSDTFAYSGATFAGGNGVSYSVAPNANLLGTVSYGGTSQGAVNVGSYGLTPGGLYSNQQGYIINYVGGTLTISQLASVAWIGGSSGNWSNRANWQGGAIPDHANVAAVTIPAGVTVTYDTAVPGTTTLHTLTDDGNLTLAGGALTVTGNLSTHGFDQAGGTLGVGGVLSIDSSAGRVTLGNLSAGTLNVISTGGAITQAAGTTVAVAGASALTAENEAGGAGATRYGVTLDGTTNDLAGPVSADGSNVNLVDDAARLTLGTVTASGNLLVTSHAGAITQAAGTSLAVAGASQLTADNGIHGAGDTKYNVALSNAANNFVGGVDANGLNVYLTDGAGGLVLNGTTATGNLLLTSSAGAISQTAGTAVTVAGASQVVADNGAHGTGAVKYNVTLGNAANKFGGAVSTNGANVAVTDGSGGILLGGTAATGNLQVTSRGGAVTQAAGTAVSVAGTSGLTADNGVSGAGDVRYGVTLGNATNDFRGKVTAAGSGILLDDATALTAAVATPGAVTLTADGKLVVSGTVGADLRTVSSGGTGSSTIFDTTTVGDTLNATSTGPVVQAAGDTLQVHGAGTTTANPYVTVNGQKGAIIK